MIGWKTVEKRDFNKKGERLPENRMGLFSLRCGLRVGFAKTLLLFQVVFMYRGGAT
jgi:hypothetical protein